MELIHSPCRELLLTKQAKYGAVHILYCIHLIIWWLLNWRYWPLVSTMTSIGCQLITYWPSFVYRDHIERNPLQRKCRLIFFGHLFMRDEVCLVSGVLWSTNVKITKHCSFGNLCKEKVGKSSIHELPTINMVSISRMTSSVILDNDTIFMVNSSHRLIIN